MSWMKFSAQATSHDAGCQAADLASHSAVPLNTNIIYLSTIIQFRTIAFNSERFSLIRAKALLLQIGRCADE